MCQDKQKSEVKLPQRKTVLCCSCFVFVSEIYSYPPSTPSSVHPHSPINRENQGRSCASAALRSVLPVLRSAGHNDTSEFAFRKPWLPQALLNWTWPLFPIMAAWETTKNVLCMQMFHKMICLLKSCLILINKYSGAVGKELIVSLFWKPFHV